MTNALACLEAALQEAGLWRKSAVLLAAVSGGPDSVALLYLLTLAQRDVGFRVCACYVQHGLRGESTLLDEALVRQLCDKWQVPLEVMQAELHASMTDPGVETLARERRRRLFAQCMEHFQADALLTAHHRDDQSETVLMRLMRGAGSKGLGGIAPIAPFGRGVMLRPLLEVTKGELTALLLNEGIPSRHDESNDLCCTPRNALRLELLPRMEALFPQAAEHIAHAADSLREDDACLETLAKTLYNESLLNTPPVFALTVSRLLDAPPALRLRALRYFYREGLALAGLHPDERELSHEDSRALLTLLGDIPGATLNLPCGLCALRGRAHLHLLRQGGAALCAGADGVILPLAEQPGTYTLCGVTLSLAPARQPVAPPKDTNSVLLPEELLSRCVLRTPRPGDMIRPFGAPGAKPLRRHLTDCKLDMPFRSALPVLARGEHILWIPALTAAEALRWKPTQRPWRLMLNGDAPYTLNQS